MHAPSKHWHLIVIIVRGTDLRGVHITRAMRGAECWTDHRMTIAMLKVRMRPAVHLRKSTKCKLHCARLQEAEVRNTFRCSLAKQLENTESLLGIEGTTTKCTLSASLYEAAAQAIGYNRKRHQDWFNENSSEISALLTSMHKPHEALGSERAP